MCKIERNEEDALKIVFQDGSEAFGNILIAADGIHSVVRKQVTQRIIIVMQDIRVGVA